MSSSLYDECLQCLLMLLRVPPLPFTSAAAATDSAEAAAAVADGSSASSVSLGPGRLPLEAAPGAEAPVVALVSAEQLSEVPAHETPQCLGAMVATDDSAIGCAAVGVADVATRKKLLLPERQR